MTRGRRVCAAALSALCLAGAASAGESEDEAELAPYQMVRSLQLVQDRIADGDHAALPMQKKLLEMIDQRFRKTRSEDFIDERNYEALLVYAMSGGNPTTINTLLAKLHLKETNRALGTGIVYYLEGDVPGARGALDPVDPMTLTPELGAFFALVKGSIFAMEDPVMAVRMYDEARLLGPGTLVEEAALRRTIGLAGHGVDAARFLSASGQYVRRFLRSPYASQFADSLVAGIVALNQTIDLDGLDEVITRMDAEQQKVVYLRLARRAAIDGLPGLAEYASGKADAVVMDIADPTSDPRAALYSGLANLTSETVDQVLPKLRAIDPSLLSESDRKLLEAAEAVATGVTSPPPEPIVDALPADGKKGDEAVENAGTAPEDGLPEAEPIETAEPTPPGEPAAQADAAGEAEAAAEGQPATAQHKPTEAGAAAATEPAAAGADGAAAGGVADGVAGEAPPIDADPTAAIVDDARKKLDEIDKLLKETAQ